MSRRRFWLAAGLTALAALLALPAVAWLRVAVDDEEPSRSIGRVGAGRLEHGHVLPPWGVGYRSYSFLGAAVGRQYLHGRVRDSLVGSFAESARRHPDLTYIVGETAVRRGGRLHGHRTHQNGLSVDLFMPVRDHRDRLTTLPTWPWQGLGYWHEFDAEGRSSGYRIDFAALAELLLILREQAAAHGLGIERVIIAPEYVPHVLATPAGQTLGDLAARLTRKPVWVRHDEHIHIDFAVSP